MPSHPHAVVLLASDLILSSSVSGVAAEKGLAFQSTSAAAEAIRIVADDAECLLLVDLGTPGLDVRQLAGSLPADVLQNAVAYGPHVHTEKLAAAREAGFGRVMSRGQFSLQIASLLAPESG